MSKTLKQVKSVKKLSKTIQIYVKLCQKKVSNITEINRKLSKNNQN